jgi:hypothetical protein
MAALNSLLKSKHVDLIITLLCLGMTYWLHINEFVNGDVAWHVEAAKRLLSGGNYLINTFDTNAPFVFVYFFPVIWLKKIVTLSLPNLITTYIALSAVLPLAFSYFLINKMILEDKIAKRLLYYAVLFIVLFLPTFNFGQREIVLIYFYLPYFLYLMLKTVYPEGPKINRWFLYCMALFAAFGILQNLFYLSIPVFIDIYIYIKTKKFRWLQAIFYLFVLTSIGISFFLYPEYFTTIIPMVMCYESGFNFPILMLLLEVFTFICLLTVSVVLINFKKLYQSDDIIICFIATICSSLIYFFELKLWDYHLYPAICFVVLLLISIIIKYYEETIYKKTIAPRVSLASTSIAKGILATILVIVIGDYRSDIAIFHNQHNSIHKWLDYAKSNFNQKKLYSLVMQLGPAYELPYYSGKDIQIVSPWSNPWVLPYVIQQSNKTNRCNLERDIVTFQAIATQALAKQQPDFIITENATWLLYKGQPFDYFEFFSQNKQFKELIKQYTYFGQFEGYTIYQKISKINDKNSPH